VLASLVALLTRWGAQVIPIGSAAAALALIENQPIDVALVDYTLGANSINGLQLIAELRRCRPGLRVALVTAELDPELPARALAAAVPMLKKPVRPAALRALLESFAE